MSVLVNSSGKAAAGSSTSFPNNIAGLSIPDNNLLYVSSDTPQASGIVRGYTFNATTGAATQVTSTTVTDNSYLTADPSGKFLYVAVVNGPIGRNNAFVPAIDTYSINAATGALTATPDTPQNIGDGTLGDLGVSPDDAWLCADSVDSSNTSTIDVICFPRQPDGSPNGNDSTTWIYPIKGMTGDGQIAFTSDAQWVFAAGSGKGSVEEGSMKNSTAAATTTGSAESTGLAVDPSGKWLLVAEQPSTLAVYSIGSNGQLTAGSTTALPAAPGQVAFSKTGADLFVATASGTAVYSFNATNGTLTAVSGSPVVGSNSGTTGAATPIAAQ